MLREQSAGGWLPWLQIEARGEDLVVALLSHLDLPGNNLNEQRVVSGVMALRWVAGHTRRIGIDGMEA